MAGRRIKTGLAAALIAAVLILPAAALSGQDASSFAGGDRLTGAAVRKFSLDLQDALTAPLHWNGGDVLLFGIAAAATGALFTVDEPYSRSIRGIELPKTADGIVAQFGNGFFLVGLNAAFYLAGEFLGNPGLRTMALVGMESFLTASAVVLVIKGLVGRARPSARETSASFHPLALQGRYTSFPSGDAAGAFAVAAVIADRSESTLIEALVYGLAGLAALNRVHDGKHWVSDVAAGSAIGWFIGRKIAGLNRGRGRTTVRVSAAPAGRGMGLAVGLSF
jgi:membrane-associated phospholipid phosphatase